ncbi:unnamed protein product (macronuclear) [Paramecium tetraurelia]|uniref:Uncharacterized protein n=1 Tax=Paramecium tetraurelia TaxID=5888 RepID=A0CG24_PARTE|nr:uncharacterized protein GSPATT00038184001 [Paramecium tetraurelia]CAK69741.1 unnamed protein product [Paramecium tetraurelia]|eukprot:XP_001437138.1 hypothetical protein (macronuclear) [Paramecium tetraurelia strain d4-2]
MKERIKQIKQKVEGRKRSNKQRKDGSERITKEQNNYNNQSPFDRKFIAKVFNYAGLFEG